MVLRLVFAIHPARLRGHNRIWHGNRAQSRAASRVRGLPARRKGFAPLTCEAYDSDLKTFAEFLESRHGVLLTSTQEDVSAFLEHLRTHGIDSRSAARKLSCIRGFYKWLLLDRRIHHDPTVNIDSPKAWKVLPKSLAESEI